MTGGYATPADVWISATWQSHKNRNPPSAEPGTDYATAYGTDLRMAGAGVISVVDTSPGGGEGRRVSVDLDDGRRVSYLHLSKISCWVGQRVGRGSTGLIWSGASGQGQEWYYGPHVHVSLWERPGMSYASTIDFENYVGDPTPIPAPVPIPIDEDEMPKNSGYSYTRAGGSLVCGIVNLGSGFFTEWEGTDGAYNTAMAVAFDTPTFAPISQSHRDALARDCQVVRDAQAPQGSKAWLVAVVAWVLTAVGVLTLAGLYIPLATG